MNSALPQPPSFWQTRIPMPFSIRGTLFTAMANRRIKSVSEITPLPSPCQETIERVVKSTRLWRGEKEEVARELYAHFRDAIESGVSPAQATEDFGDPRVAAQTIREAKVNNRPLAWRMGKRFLQGGGIFLLFCLLVYGVMSARFYFSSPNITHNYAKEIATRKAVAENQRAYPIYRAFFISQHKADIVANFPDLVNVTPDVMPGEVGWEDAKKYSRQFAADLTEVRRGAALPTIGAPLTNGEDALVFDEVTKKSNPLATFSAGEENPMLLGVLLPHLGWSRMIARSLIVDARVALAEGDTARYHQDMTALLNVGRQLADEPFFIGRLVHVAVIALADQEIRRLLTTTPEFLSESQLTELAHSLSAATNGTLKMNMDSEKLWIDDWLQRSFTDDGNGDGRLTPEGFKLLASLDGASRQQAEDLTSSFSYRAASPVLPSVLAGRKELRDTYLRLLNLAEQDATVPRWQRTGFTSAAEIEKLTNSQVRRTRLGPVLMFIPATNKAIETCEQGTTDRDATLAAIAIELFHRKHGVYPQKLTDLVPALLPAAPIDMWDGQPLKYGLRDGKPLLYSVGCDKKDNGGAYTDDWTVLTGRVQNLNPQNKDKDWLYLPHTRKPPTVEPVKRPTPPSGPEVQLKQTN